LVFVVMLGPGFVLHRYFLGPSRYAVNLRRALPPRVLVAVGAASVSFEVHGRATAIPWSAFKAVVEAPALFLLVASPFAFTFVPKLDMPAAGLEALHARSTSVLHTATIDVHG
jgi:hypothetical protein